MKITAKKTAVFAGTVLCTAVCASFFLFGGKNQIAFYGLSESQVKGIESVIDAISEKQKIKYEYLVYDQKKNLSSLIPISKKPELVFTVSGHGVESAVSKAEKKSGVKIALLAGMTNSLQQKAFYDESKNTVLAVPLLSDHIEIDVRKSDFEKSKVGSVSGWKDFEKLCEFSARKTTNPIVFSGRKPDTTLDMMGAMAESIDGTSSYEEAKKILKENEKNFDAVKVAKLLCDNDNSPLITSVRLLSKWYKKGWIHPESFSFSANDVDAFVKSGAASIVFSSLEEKRSMKSDSLTKFSTSYYLSEKSGAERTFTGKIVFAVPLSKSENSRRLISQLVSPEYQEELSRATGLAPALAQCRTPDKQAYEARYWIAQSNPPHAGLSREIFISEKQKNSLAAEIASRIKGEK